MARLKTFRRLENLNQKLAKDLWRQNISRRHLAMLRVLTRRFQFSVSAGEVTLLDGNWYVTHTGLLGLAQRKNCQGIKTYVYKRFSDPALNRWVFRAVVQKKTSNEFSSFGDADPSNVSPLMHGAEMRIAETRAVNRALRKAYGIGLCSVEELGSLSASAIPDSNGGAAPHSSQNSSRNGQPRLRDRLCLLIRQYNLDPNLVKAYAADFCGTTTLKDATRDLIESFVLHLSSSVKEDRDGLICKLNSYSRPAEMKQ